MQLARGILALAALWAFRLARAVVAFLGLSLWLGVGWAVAILLLAAAFRWHWLLRMSAFLALLLLWQWPWWVALPVCMPRAVLMLPGLINTAVARLRHPRPVWPAWSAASASASASLPVPAPAASGAHSATQLSDHGT